ncbi:glucoamylase 1 [Umbelopsis sp. AD052]|nr:glucoamylase 1 [Umbelopsis sp. AD052]
MRLHPKNLASWLVSLAFIVGSVIAAVPTSPVKLNYYTYQNSVFSGQIYVQNIAYSKVVTVIWADSSNNWSGYSTPASFYQSISGTSYEYWNFTTTIGSSGISQFYIQYQVNGNTYYDNNNGYGSNYPVTATTASSSSSTTKATTTKASTTGTTTTTSATTTATASTGIASWVNNEASISYNIMYGNINVAGAAPGFIAASPSTSSPDYYYAWVRDSALTMHVVVNQFNTTGAKNSTISKIITDYVTFQANAQTESTPCNCLGEPKFNPDGSAYTGAWGRPQNDGPAERAITLIKFADSWIGQGNSATYISNTVNTVIFKDLDYITTVWSNTCFDLWEEVNALHFFTLMVQRRALLAGAEYAARVGHSNNYATVAASIATKIDTFWSSSSGIVQTAQNYASGVNYKSSGLDVAVLLAAIHGGIGDGFYTSSSDKILATSLKIKNSFASLYAVNSNTSVGTAIGRYPEDQYNGVGTSQGNPWFLSTVLYAELYYRAILEWKAAGKITVTSISQPFFAQFYSSAASGDVYTSTSTQFSTITTGVANAADLVFARVQKHANTDGSLSEEFDRTSGFEIGAVKLTWSHAAFITAALARSGTPSF